MAVNKDFLVKNGIQVGDNAVVTGSLTAAGLAYPVSDGSIRQAIVTDGAGSLDFADVDTVESAVTNQTGSLIPKGAPVYQTGVAGNNLTIALSDASNAATMPAIGVTASDIANGASGYVIHFGPINGVDTSSFSEGDRIYVAPGGGYQSGRPSGEGNVVQFLGVVTKIHASNGGGIVFGGGRSMDVPNLDEGNIFIGQAGDTATTATLDTDLVPEGSNLYYTDTRAVDAVEAHPHLTIDGGTLYVDTDNNYVGIGDTSPQEKLDVAGNAQVQGNIVVTGTVDGRDVATDGAKLDGIESGATADQTKADIDALGINAATLDSLDSTQFLRSDQDDTMVGGLTIRNSDWENVLKLNRNLDVDTVGAAGLKLRFGAIYQGADVYPVDITGVVDTDGTAGWLSIGMDGADVVTVKSNGDVLIGTTDGSPYNNTTGEGIVLGSGHIWAAADGESILDINRMSSDGNLINFYRDGGIAGRIGVKNTNLSIGSDDVGVIFNKDSNEIYSWNVTTGASSTGVTSLGTANAKFKDGWFSGTLNASKGSFGHVSSTLATDKATMQQNAAVYIKPHELNSTNLSIAEVGNGDTIALQVTNSSATANWHVALSPFGGNVGIGTTIPSAKLHVDNVIQSNDSVDYPVIISQSDPSNSLNQVGGSGVGILFKAATNSTAEIGASIAAVKPGGSDDDTTTDLAFYVSQNDTTLDEAVRIKNNGFVGIGTDSPVEKLYVNSDSGDVRIGLNAPTGSDAEIKFSNNNIVEYTIGHDDATDNFVIGTTNVDADLVSVTKSGNVGIGTSAPLTRLHVNGTSYMQWPGVISSQSNAQLVLVDSDSTNMRANFIVEDETNGGRGGLMIQATESGVSNDRDIYLQAHGGRVGIGTFTPEFELDVNGHIYTNQTLYAGGGSITSGSSTGSVKLYGGGTYEGGTIQAVGGLNSTDPGTLKFRTGTGTGEQPLAMIIDANRRVGIGTTSPSYKLDVAGDVRSTGRMNVEYNVSTSPGNLSEGYSIYAFGIQNRAGGSRLNFGGSAARTTIQAASGTSTAEDIVLNPWGGNIGFGAGYADATASWRTTDGFRVMNPGGTGGYMEHVRTTSSDVSANVYMARSEYTNGRMFSFNTSSAEVGSITINTSGTTYNTTSDRRLKDNIVTITDGKEKLLAMNPVTHTWIANPDAPAVHGFIAQEMKEVVPEAVSGEADGEDMMSMDYGRITPVIVAALQDALKEIEELKTRISQLEDK